jgi:hypothetical protein
MNAGSKIHVFATYYKQLKRLNGDVFILNVSSKTSYEGFDFIRRQLSKI